MAMGLALCRVTAAQHLSAPPPPTPLVLSFSPDYNTYKLSRHSDSKVSERSDRGVRDCATLAAGGARMRRGVVRRVWL